MNRGVHGRRGRRRAPPTSRARPRRNTGGATSKPSIPSRRVVTQAIPPCMRSPIAMMNASNVCPRNTFSQADRVTLCSSAGRRTPAADRLSERLTPYGRRHLVHGPRPLFQCPSGHLAIVAGARAVPRQELGDTWVPSDGQRKKTRESTPGAKCNAARHS